MFPTMLYAQCAQGGESAQGGGLLGFLPIIIMFVILYFLLIRPQQKRQKEVEKMREELRKNDKVITSGGILGTIYSIKGETIVLKVNDDIKIEVKKSAIAGKQNN
ncbi:MAG: preprotein translocase subunit YajC [Candidatus Cloacimonetes bacterium]|nr:preprotein translocase subunit YajC [Candidatus Cloacimonadota bacterium]MBS3766505.1 preprotein translocase subunit YajC [Candidatus Cloacimonadota bacterium]